MEITFDKRNYRKHSKRNKALIRQSLQDVGAGRSVLIDAEGALIAGNGVYEQAQALGIPTKVVETDGSELVVVKRTDLHSEDDKRKRLAVLDNSASDSSTFDMPLLLADFSVDELQALGVDNIPETLKNSVGAEIEKSIYYEPKDAPASLSECVDMTKYNAKMDALRAIFGDDMDEELWRVFCGRFIRIDYERCADYYVLRATDDERRAMERLRLVLVDNGVGGFIEDDLLRLITLAEGVE